MFDISTGIVSHGKVTLRRGETREDFLAANSESNIHLIVENQGWSTYRFSPDQEVFFVLQFKKGVIEQVRIAFSLDSNGSNSWTVESETARKLFHDQILRKEIGAPPYKFSWGQIDSVTDPQSGASQIILSYA